MGVPVSPLVSLVGDRDTTLYFWMLPVTVALGTMGATDTGLTTGWTLGTVVLPGQAAHGHRGPWGNMGQCGTGECGGMWGQSGEEDMGACGVRGQRGDMGTMVGHGGALGPWGQCGDVGTVGGTGTWGQCGDSLGTVWGLGHHCCHPDGGPRTLGMTQVTSPRLGLA